MVYPAYIKCSERALSEEGAVTRERGPLPLNGRGRAGWTRVEVCPRAGRKPPGIADSEGRRSDAPSPGSLGGRDGRLHSSCGRCLCRAHVRPVPLP